MHEEECGVRRAVAEGRIPAGRYRGYLRLLGLSADAGGADEAAPFQCANCGAEVSPGPAGTRHRNHSPYCLFSKHLDNRPGDRAASCGGLMEPIAVWVRAGGEWAVIHRCKSCGALRANRIAADDNEMLLLQLAVKPLAMPAFPLSRLGKKD
ncbi:MAG: RNHCP domain-containing protein [Firmicutes bacterium]|nr:RNHCP domain-containing protein [Bacillota bacterium]